jgi:hypothetical protein
MFTNNQICFSLHLIQYLNNFEKNMKFITLLIPKFKFRSIRNAHLIIEFKFV